MVTVKIGNAKDSAPPVWKELMTIDELVKYCTLMDPARAATLGDSTLCVSPLVMRLVMDGTLHELSPIDGKWAAHQVRVSTARQRAKASRFGNDNKKPRKAKKKKKVKDDGYSEEDQLIRGIRYHVLKGQAFKVYSDAGITGEYPANRPHLIERLVKKKADRYKRVFGKVALDPVSASKRTPLEIDGMKRYLEERLEAILSCLITEDQIYAPNGEGLDEYTKRARRGRPRTKALFRMGFDQLWTDVEAGHIHEITASDHTRVCRDADLETEFLQVISRHKVRVFGVIEDMSQLDVADPVGRGINYLLACYSEKKLEEQATGSLRGKLQKLENGCPCGQLPWWLETDEDDRAVVKDGCKEIVGRIVHLAAAGDGDKVIARKMRQEGWKVEEEFVSEYMVGSLLTSDAIRGISSNFGIKWPIYPNLIDDPEVLEDIRAVRAKRRGANPALEDTSGWGCYLLTSITRCFCGRAARRVPGPQDLSGRRRSYYSCTQGNKRIESKEHHACVNTRPLEAFLEELVSGNPNILTGALSMSLGVRGSSERVARRAILEEHIRFLSTELEAKEIAARKQAEEAALRLRISPESSQYESVVTEAIKGMLEAELAELDTLKCELLTTNADCSKDRQNERFNAAIAQLGGWHNLDVLTRNRLLCSIFETITLFPRTAGGKAVIKLVGVDTPLPPVWFDYKACNELTLPTVGEWIESAFDPRKGPEVRVALKSRSMRPFYRFMRGLKGYENTAELAKLITGDRKFPRRTSCKETVAGHLSKIGATDAQMQVFEEIWHCYITDERARIKCKLDGALPAQKPEHIVGGDVLQ